MIETRSGKIGTVLGVGGVLVEHVPRKGERGGRNLLVMKRRRSFVEIWNLIYNEYDLLVLRCSCSCDDFHQFSGNDGLTRAIEEDLEFVDHVSRILGGVLCRDTC